MSLGYARENRRWGTLGSTPRQGFLVMDEGKVKEAAKLLGSKGGSKGGIERAKKLSPERRKEIATKAAAVRWGKEFNGQGKNEEFSLWCMHSRMDAYFWDSTRDTREECIKDWNKNLLDTNPRPEDAEEQRYYDEWAATIECKELIVKEKL